MVFGFGVAVSASSRRLSNVIFQQNSLLAKEYQEGLGLLHSRRLLFGQIAIIDNGRLAMTRTIFSFQPQPIVYTAMKLPASSHNYLQRSLFSSKNNTKMPSVDEEFRHLDYNQLIELKSKERNTVLIDVREKHELEQTGVLPDSHHIPLLEINQALTLQDNEFEASYNFPKPHPQDHVVFSCRSGRRSMVALEKALAQGFINAKHYKGGWIDWEQKTAEPKEPPVNKS